MSIIAAPRNVSLNSDGWSRANESADLLYSASVMRSADFKPFSVENEKASSYQAVISFKRITVDELSTDLREQAALLVGLICDERPEIPVYSWH